MSNIMTTDDIAGLKLLIDKDNITEDDLSELQEAILEYPNLLSNLSLEQVVN